LTLFDSRPERGVARDGNNYFKFREVALAKVSTASSKCILKILPTKIGGAANERVVQAENMN
jgi:hypothetical protein